MKKDSKKYISKNHSHESKIHFWFDYDFRFFFPTKICDMNQDDRGELVRNNPRYANKKLHTTGVSGSSSSSSSLLSSISSVTSALASAMSSLRGLLSVTLATKGCYVDGQRQKTSTWIRNLKKKNNKQQNRNNTFKLYYVCLCIFGWYYRLCGWLCSVR